jgi:cobalt-zinc-cadmium efflux system membrane fusion protein
MTGFKTCLASLAALLLLALLTVGAARAHEIETVGPFGAPIPVSSLGKSAIGVQTASVVRKSIPMEVSLPGKIEVIPTRQFDQHAPLSGRISSVSVSLGQMVTQGQTLAVIESPEMNQLAAQLLQSRLDIESEISRQQAALDEEVRQAEERYTLADSNYKRTVSLHNARIAAQKDVAAAEAEYHISDTRLKTARQNRDITLRTLKSRLELTLHPLRQRLRMLGVEENEIAEMLKHQQTLTQVPVEAARSGFITNIAASAGKSIDPSVSLFTIADLTKVWATAQVYESDMSRMRIGERVHVKVHALQKEHVDGVLTFVGTAVDPLTRTLPVRAEIDNPGYRLKPDMFAELMIETSDSAPILTVPHDAVLQQAGHSIVFVETGNAYQPVYVIEGRSFGDLIEIRRGLHDGDRVVVQGAFQLGAELVKTTGGAAQFSQATEGERSDEEDAKKVNPALSLSIQTVVVIVAVAFLLGFGICAMVLFRRNGHHHHDGQPADPMHLPPPDSVMNVVGNAPAGEAPAAQSATTSAKGSKQDHV